MNTKVMFSSNTDEWATPQEIFDELNNEFGFDLDPCATEENHKCPEYYTKANNGLNAAWGGEECSAILRIQGLENGLPNVTRKATKKIRLLSCLFRQGQTQNIFMIIS